MVSGVFFFLKKRKVKLSGITEIQHKEDLTASWIFLSLKIQYPTFHQ
jgi:hypothetical protein